MADKDSLSTRAEKLMKAVAAREQDNHPYYIVDETPVWVHTSDAWDGTAKKKMKNGKARCQGLVVKGNDDDGLVVKLSQCNQGGNCKRHNTGTLVHNSNSSDELMVEAVGRLNAFAQPQPVESNDIDDGKHDTAEYDTAEEEERSAEDNGPGMAATVGNAVLSAAGAGARVATRATVGAVKVTAGVGARVATRAAVGAANAVTTAITSAATTQSQNAPAPDPQEIPIPDSESESDDEEAKTPPSQKPVQLHAKPEESRSVSPRVKPEAAPVEHKHDSPKPNAATVPTAPPLGPIPPLQSTTVPAPPPLEHHHEKKVRFHVKPEQDEIKPHATHKTTPVEHKHETDAPKPMPGEPRQIHMPHDMSPDMNKHNQELLWLRAFVHLHGKHYAISNGAELREGVRNTLDTGKKRCRGAVLLDSGTVVQCTNAATRANALCNHHATSPTLLLARREGSSALTDTTKSQLIYHDFVTSGRDDGPSETVSAAGQASFNHILSMTKSLSALGPESTKSDAMEKFRLVMNDPVMGQFDKKTAESIRKHLASFIDRYDHARDHIYRNCTDIVQHYLQSKGMAARQDIVARVQRRLIDILYRPRPFDPAEVAEAVYATIHA